MHQLHSVVLLPIKKGIKLEWEAANTASDKLLRRVYGSHLLNSNVFRGWNSRNSAAMEEFIKRSDRGMNLSQRVWKSCRQLGDEMEAAITVSIGEGESAGTISRRIRQYLNDPELMFHRFKYNVKEPMMDDKGNIVYGKDGKPKTVNKLDKDGYPIEARKWKKRVIDPATGKYKFIDYDKDSYHDQWTGRGYYKSAAQNAMRVARTETNMAYRRADHERWKRLDFVLGVRVELSKNHPEYDICDELKGDYPKDFVFDGWHPQCFCHAVPILIEPNEMLKRNEALVNGEEYTPKGNPIKEVPQGFKDWVMENQDKILTARQRGTEPYFIRNNFGVVDKIINPQNYRKAVAADIDDVVPTPKFVPAKTLEEVQKRMHDVGIKEVSLSEINVEEANYLLEVFEQADTEYGIELNKFIVAKNISNIKGYGIGKDAAGSYVHNSSVLLIDTKNFARNHYQTTIPYEDRITKQRDIINRLNTQIKQTEAHLGRNKSSDRMLKQEIKSIKERIYQAEMKIRGYEDLIKRGYAELPSTVAETFEDIKSQVQAELWHEIGHYLDYRAAKSYGYNTLVSEYSDKGQRELFAEWFSYYKMRGEQGVPKQFLDIFKSQERTNAFAKNSSNNHIKGVSQKGSSRSLTTSMMNEIPEDYMGKTKVSAEQRKNHLKICEKLNIPKREPKPMSFIEADSGKGNEDRKNYETINNCTSCVLANEMRRRGFDVTAKGQVLAVALDIKKCWLTKEGRFPNLETDPKNLICKSKEKLKQELERRIIGKGRYILAWDGQGKLLGHVLCVERINGVLCFFDPQETKTSSFWKLDEIFAQMDADKGLELLRIDNLLINLEYVQSMVRIL